VAFLATAQELTTPAATPHGAPDKEKVSYAQGMHMGLQVKQAGIGGVDADVFAQAIKDVLEGKPTQLQESEIAALLNQARAEGIAAQAATNQERVSYAMGMRLGMQLKRAGVEVDANVIAQGLKDVLEGKPTKIQESEIEPLFRQAQAYGLATQSSRNKTEGEAFLARNAKAPGIVVLPDGLQYRVTQAGAGETPTTNDLIFIKYRGTLVNGVEFDHKDHFLTRINGGIKGMQEALQRMKVGSKLQIFVPPALAYGAVGESVHHVGPGSTLIYELELLSIARPGDPGIGTGRVGHGLGEEASLPDSIK
jgi:FKBP-type peptidyl-prolyl cis-trans isomerase FklB